MDKLKSWWSAHRPSTRRLVQLYTALLYNAHLKGFAEGEIYRGGVKGLCVPGLNCYSCPAAVGACPLGALQNAVAASASRPAFYVVGVLLLFGLTLGRVICGWACPMGLLQELLHKLPTPKLKKSRLTRALTWVKYGLLALLVIAVPLYYAFRRTPLPAFCKYICPAGTLEGALGLLLHPANGDKLGLLGPLFTNKLIVLLLIALACVFLYRAFCRFLCPLGALYGLMTRLALLGVKLDETRCTDCGVCRAVCPMDIRRVGDRECISCGKCVSRCPEAAIRFRAGKLLLHEPAPGAVIGRPPEAAGNRQTADVGAVIGRPPEAAGKSQSAAVGAVIGRPPEAAAKRNSKNRILAGALALALLAGALVGFNLPAATPEASEPAETASQSEAVGNAVGKRLPDFSVEMMDGTEFRLSDHRGQPVLLNVWATWCGPCVKELPYFADFARAHPDAALLALHGSLITEDVEAWLAGTDYGLPFAIDADGSISELLGVGSMLPHTLVLDGRGVVIYNAPGSMTPELLEELYRQAREE